MSASSQPINFNHSHEITVLAVDELSTHRSSFHHRHAVDPDALPHLHEIGHTGRITWTPQAEREIEKVRRIRTQHV